MMSIQKGFVLSIIIHVVVLGAVVFGSYLDIKTPDPVIVVEALPGGTEEDLRTRLKAPALNHDQDLYISQNLKSGKVMVKDEDVVVVPLYTWVELPAVEPETVRAFWVTSTVRPVCWVTV